MRDALAERRPVELTEFTTVVRGGGYTLDVAGVAGDCERAMAATKSAEAWCRRYALTQSFTCYYSTYSGDAASMLVLAWAHRMQWMFGVGDPNGPSFVYADSDLAGYAETEEFASWAEAQTSPAVQRRVAQIRAIRPGAPVAQRIRSPKHSPEELGTTCARVMRKLVVSLMHIGVSIFCLCCVCCQHCRRQRRRQQLGCAGLFHDIWWHVLSVCGPFWLKLQRFARPRLSLLVVGLWVHGGRGRTTMTASRAFGALVVAQFASSWGRCFGRRSRCAFSAGWGRPSLAVGMFGLRGGCGVTRLPA